MTIQDNRPIYLILPVGSFHGWGICGSYITKELSRITDVRLISEPQGICDIPDEFERYLLESKLASQDEYTAIKSGLITQVNSPVLQCISGNSLEPAGPDLKGTKRVGYTFFEDNILPPQYIENGRKFFDVIAAGSKWNEEVLRAYGLTNVTTVIQGIDPLIFNPVNRVKEYFKDRFVVFSGGKFELRKGQDIVIRAYKVLQDKYDDVMLVNSWFNMWQFSLETMAASPYLKFAIKSDDYAEMMNHVLHDNGIDLNRVITTMPRPNYGMPKIYSNTDVGLFPNRCEGGTNLVLMEYMACGKPAIASFNTGHRDILADDNSLKINSMQKMNISSGDVLTAKWDEPDLDETISHLEWAYHNRDRLRDLGNKAGKDLSHLTWARTAKEFYDCLTK
jgi:glycosyltransferase involved in cell wall biosynthesis